MTAGKSRGQVFTLDMFIAILGLVIVLSYASMWYQQAYSGADRIEQMKLDQIAQDLAQIIVKENLAYHDQYGNRYPNYIKGTGDEVSKKLQDTFTQVLGSEYYATANLTLNGLSPPITLTYGSGCDPSKQMVGVTSRPVYYDSGSGNIVPAKIRVMVCAVPKGQQNPALNPSNMPDLTGTVSVDPQNPNPGDPIKVTVKVNNDGQQEVSQSFKVTVRLDDPVNGEVLKQYTVSSVTAGGTVSLPSFMYTAPSKEGSHMVYAVIDSENTVTETSETNNIAHAVFTVGLPDLIVGGINLDNDHLAPGDPITGKYVITNVGIGSAKVDGVHNTVTVTSDDGTKINSGETIMTGTIPSMSSAEAGINIALPSDLGLDESNPEKQLTVTAVLDDEHSLTESNEDNNQGVTHVWVGLPNLRPVELKVYDDKGNLLTEITDPNRVATVKGDSTNMYYLAPVIENSMPYPLEKSFKVSFYIMCGSSSELSGDITVNSLAPNEQLELPKQKLILKGGCDRYDVYVNLDSDNQVTESNEDDNQGEVFL